MGAKMGAKKFFLAMAFLLVFFATVVFAQNVAFTAETKTVSLEAGSQAPILLDFANNGPVAARITVQAIPSDSLIEALPKIKEFSLNPGETTSFSLDVKALANAVEKEYSVSLVPVVKEGRLGVVPPAQTIAVNVFNGGREIAFVPQNNSGEICIGGYTKEFEIVVKNQSAVHQNAALFSESDIFFPQFDPSSVSFDAGGQKNVNLKINLNGFSHGGKYSLPLYAKTGAGNISAGTLSFELSECSTVMPFDFSVDSKNISMQKFATKQFFFTLENNLGKAQDVFFSAKSDLEVIEGQSAFTLNPDGSQQGHIEIKTREFDTPGLHFIDLFAWSEFGKQKETITVLVGKNHDIIATLLNNNLETQSCSATKIAVFSVEFQNNGDGKEKIILSIKNSDKSIGVAVAEGEFELLPQQKKTVSIAVSPGFDTETGLKQITLRIKAPGFGFSDELPLSFIVAAPGNILPQQQLKIVSAPQEISAVAGEEKTVSLKVENTGAAAAEGLVARVRGVDGSQFLFSQESIPAIAQNDSALVNFDLKVLAGARSAKYSLTIEIVSNNRVVATAPFTLAINHPQKGAAGISAQNTEISRIIGFLGLAGGQMATLPIILIVAVGIILLFLLASSGNNKRVVWKNYN